MNLKYVEPFKQATNNVLSMMAATEVTFAAAGPRTTAKSFGAITGMIGMTAAGVSGNMLISFDEPSILGVIENLVGERYPNIGQDVIDAVGELTNMICGGAKAIFSKEGLVFDMATPAIIVGQGIEIGQVKGQQVVSVLCSTPSGQFVIESCFVERPL